MQVRIRDGPTVSVVANDYSTRTSKPREVTLASYGPRTMQSVFRARQFIAAYDEAQQILRDHPDREWEVAVVFGAVLGESALRRLLAPVCRKHPKAAHPKSRGWLHNYAAGTCRYCGDIAAVGTMPT